MFRFIRQKMLFCLLGFGCLSLIGTPTLFAQGTTGTITGVVTDSTGAVIPGATVTVLNQRTGVDFHLTTNNSGVYSITSLIPGVYTVTVAHKGFQTYVNRDLTMTVNEVLRIDVQMEVGAETQTITVEAAAPLVNTEEGRLSAVVTASQVENMPLNGRNIYSLMQLVPGAINTTGVNLEQDTGGIQTNINGTRANFNGFLLDGVANKSLSGGSNAQPSPDFVQEFRIMTNDYSAQYGNSAGSITDVSIKSGTNDLHGSVYEYLRNDKLNARNFFDGADRSKWRQNQFGASLGGPVKKEKLFFFAGYEGERFRTENPQLIQVETAAWKQAVRNALPSSTATLLYQDFPAPDPEFGFSTVAENVAFIGENDVGAVLYDGTNAEDAAYGADALGDPAGFLTNYYQSYTDPCFLYNWLGIGTPAFTGGPTWGDAQATANKFAALLGVTAEDQAQIQSNISAVDGCAGFSAPTAGAGTIAGDVNMLGLVNAKVASRGKGQFYNGDQFVGRLDYQGDKSRIFGRVIHWLSKDPNLFNSNVTSGHRGTLVPQSISYPSAAFGHVYSFSPTVVNEFRAGYTRNQLSDIPDPDQFGVPFVGFDFGDTQFGAYNGYPQFFIENVYNYTDMVAVVSGRHSMKFGAEIKRNLENSEFNVGRPSYYFFDQIYFAADLPYLQASGVNPELVTGGSSHIDTNIRAWRNTELGFYVQDDWKVGKNLTLNLGLRWDYFGPHTEKYGQVTNFLFAPGGLADINCSVQVGGNCVAPPAAVGNTPNGGFIAAERLFEGDKNNFSPRFGFAWDPFGNGKTSIRGGFAIFYESTLYNPLSNSRWNLPFYSFNIACPICGNGALPVYGPTNTDGTPNTSATPTYGGAPDNPGQGPEGLGFAGNIMGWYPGSPNLAYLTGVPDSSLRTPYVENGFLGIQRELSPTMVLEVNWVGTFGKKLFWAENPNRVVNGRARTSVINPCTGEDEAPSPLVNPCFGYLRTWKNSVNSNYNALQVSLNRKMSNGLAFTTSYTWSHTLDFRSSWHGGTSGGSATELNGYGSSGYSLDPNAIFLEYGNSMFDVRHRFVSSIIWELPWLKSQQGVVGKVFGGWQTNYILTLQSGLPFTVGIRSDLNGDGVRNDRPNIFSFGNHYNFTNEQFMPDSGSEPGSSFMADLMSSEYDAVTDVAAGSSGNLGRNTFSGPGLAQVDFSLFKTVPFNERVKLQFRAEFFNLFNRVNLIQPNPRIDAGTFGLSDQASDPRVIQFGLRLSF